MPIFRRQDEAPRERSAEERERARAERAARRAARGDSFEFPAVPDETLPRRSHDGDVRDLSDERDEFAGAGAEFAPEPPEEPPAREPAPDPPPAPPPKIDPPEPPPAPPDERLPPPPPPEEPPPRDPPPDALQETVAFDALAHHDEDLAPRWEEPPPVERVRAEDPTLAGESPTVADWAPDAPPVEETAVARQLPDPLGDGRWRVDDEVEDPLAPIEEHAVEEHAVEEAHEPVEEAHEPVAEAHEPVVEEPPPIVPPAARRARSGRAQAGDGERPVPPKRVSARERRRSLPPTPPPPGTPAFSKRRRRRGRILAFLLLLVLVGIAFAANMVFQPFKGEGGEEITVRIPPNSSIADVGDVLAERGIVDSAFVFTLRARLAGADLKAGTYRLKQDSSYGDALDALKDDPAAPRTVNVTIPEGRSRTETAPLVKDAGLEGDYVKATASRKGFSPRKYGAPRSTKTLEGFLFPATYELKPGAKATALVDQQLAAFDENIAKVDLKRAKRRNLTTYDVLIIASMVEREASLAKERPIIAAVIHNRLRQGMPLGIDATIRYATRNWQRPIRQSELRLDSPYNTYRRTGLPPTPIGSPGLDSIRAAANPARVDYLFYVIKPGGDGAHNFSSTDEEFQDDVDAYNAERERRGGKSPASSG
ncbi:MAG TPA: endolytic transglycosylase MltG [Solirubrobacteraceae bacterium]|jgi:uncharacterized YceG family protein